MPGPDANVNIDVTANADPAAAEIERKFREAVTKALESPAGKAAINDFVKQLTAGFAKVGKEQEKVWKQATQAGTQAARTIGKMFDEVAAKSKKALSFNEARGSSNELQAMNALVATLSGNFERLATDVRTTNTVLTQMGAGARAQLAAVEQERRTLQQELTSRNATENTAAQERSNIRSTEAKRYAADLRLQTAQLRTSSAERIAEIRRFTQIVTTSIRGLTQVFRTTFNAAASIVRSFVNGAEATVRGLATAFRTTFAAISRTVQTFASAFGRAFAGIGRGVTSALSGVSRAIRSALNRDEQSLNASLTRRERSMQSSAGRQQSIFSRGASALGLLGGGAAVGSLLTSGFQRAGQVEQLRLTFTALLGSAPQADAVLGRLSDFARTTAFDFTEVAQSTAQLTAALGDVGQAEQLTKFLADVVSLTGGTTEALGRVRLAFSQIAGAGRLDAANLRQITESLPGVPIAQILADKFFGGDVQAYSQARDAGELGGKISAEAFFTAFEEGTKERFPEVEGFAQEAATTLTGMMQNLKENFAIFGATIITLAQGPIKAAIGGLNTFLGLAGSFVSGKMFSTNAGTTPWGSQLTTGLSDTMKKLELFRDILGKVLLALGGLLALKGTFALFGVLGNGIRLALTPMGLLVIGVSAVTAAWAFFARTNERFAATWRVVTYQFKPAIDAIKNLGGALKNAFFGGAGTGDGKASILTRIGDALRYVNVGLGRVLVGFRNFANSLADSLNTKGFTDFFDSLDTAIGEGLFELFYGPDAEARKSELKAQGGSFILNVLEGTFLGPVISFFRGPFLNVAKTVIGFIANVVGQISSAIGGIWAEIFHGRPGSDNIQNVILGEEDQRSTGSKILDRLETTFLGPIVRFFRGPFADVIESIGNFIGGLFEDYLIPGFKGIFNFFAHDFIPGVVSVAQSVGKFLSPAVQTVGNLLGQVGTLLAPIGGAIEGFVSTWKDKGVAGAFSSLWDGVTEAAANIWDGVDGNGGIKAGLESAISSISSWFSTTFTGKNVLSWIETALNGIRKVGQAIGKFIGSPEFLGTVIIVAGAFTAAIAAILGAFTLGLIQGLAKEGVRWGKLIAGALQDGWNNLTKGALSFVPGPIADGISAMLGNPIIGTGIAAATALLGGVVVKSLIGSIASASVPGAATPGAALGGANIRTLGINIASGLFNSVVGGFKGVGKGALSLASLIIPRFPTGDGTAERSVGTGIGSRIIGGMSNFFRAIPNPLSGLQTKLQTIKGQAVDKFGSVGTAIATAVIGGIAAYEFGNYAGKKGDAGGILLALLGGAATGGAIGATFGGVGAGIGAAIGLGIAGLGVYFGQAAKKAQEFDDVVQSIRESLSGINSDNATAALVDNISTRLTENAGDFADWGQQLSDSFDFGNFVQQILDGTAEADTAFADFVTGMQDQLLATGKVAPDVLQNFLDNLTLAAKTGDYSNLSDLMNRVFENIDPDVARTIEDAFKALPGEFTGIIDGSGDAGNAFKFLKTTVDGATAAQAQLAAQSDIVTTALSGNVDVLDTVEEAVSAINDALTANDTGQQIADILSNGDLSTADAMTALAEAADQVSKRLDVAKQALRDALDAVELPTTALLPTSLQGVTDQIVAGLPNVADAYKRIMEDTEISPNIQQAQLRLQTQGFGDDVSKAISDAVDAGLITDDASMDTFLNGLKSSINEAGLGPDVTSQLNGVIDAFINQDFSGVLTPITDALTDQQRIQEAARTMASVFRTTLGAAQALGGPAALGSAIGTGASSAIKPPSLDLSGIIDPTATAAAGTAGGQQVADAFGPGFTGGRQRIISHIKTDITTVGTSVEATSTAAGFRSGLTFATGYGSGIRAGVSVAQANAGSLSRLAAISAAIGSLQMYSIGANAGAAFARGMLSQVQQAANAARAIAQAATNSAKRALAIHSPSRVFIDIGKQIGQGFVKGIEDSTTSMTDALSTALETAIKAAVDQSYEAVNRANVAGKLFETLQPSALPGGTSTLDVTKATTGITTQLGGFTSDLRSGLSDALGGVAHDALREAQESIRGLPLGVSGGFTDTRGQVNDAKAAKAAIDAYNASLAKLRTQLAAGTLGTIAANRERGAAYQDLIADQNALNDKIARLRAQLNAGSISSTTFNDKVKDLRDSFNSTSVERYQEELDRINRALKNGTLNQQEYRDQLDKLGQRPDALSFDQANLLRSGFATLNVGTLAGKANNDTLSDALTTIREYGQAALEQGAPLATVITQMETYVANLIRQARAAGLAQKDIDALVKAFGLTNTQLNTLKATIVSLNTSTVQGAENVAKINEQLGSIRDYATTLLNAGNSTDSVIAKIKALRNSLIAQAKAFGFNAAGIDALVAAAGLSDSALADFIKQLNDYTAAVKGATGATPPGATGQGVQRPIGELHVHLPYGDPEAVALSTANRIAYDSLSSWS